MAVKSINSNIVLLLQLKKKLNQNNESQILFFKNESQILFFKIFKIYILCGTRDSQHLVEKEYVM